jgi:hypothetical protein
MKRSRIPELATLGIFLSGGVGTALAEAIYSFTIIDDPLAGSGDRPGGHQQSRPDRGIFR